MLPQPYGYNHTLGPQSKGHSGNKHFLVSNSLPTQSLPPPEASCKTFLALDWLPNPHVTEQTDQSEKPDQRQSTPENINHDC